MRHFFSVIFLSVCYYVGVAQTTVSGVLVKPAGEQIPLEATLLFYGKEKNVIAFCISNKNGEFSTTFKSDIDSIKIQVRSLAIKDTTIAIRNRTQHISIPIKGKSHNIDEVRVQRAPITERGDTTVYRVAAFSKPSDRSIGDVIAKMPGFDVDASGKISYQGRSIQKYYIEGLDLLGSRYTIANENLPHADVASVEVLHNHQPIKVAEKVLPSDGTSLNIKLKRSVSFTGSASVTVGYEPWLGGINLSPMLFGKGHQLIASVQGNNIGSNLGRKHQSITLGTGISIADGLYTLKHNYLSVPSLGSARVAESRYLRNLSALMSFNYLTKFKNDLELKLNVSYYRDRTLEDITERSSYFLGDTTLSLEEQYSNKIYSHSIVSSLQLLRNATGGYLQEKIEYAQFWDHALHRTLSNSTERTQTASLPHLSLVNNFQVLLPVGGTFFNIQSVVDYNRTPQYVEHSPFVELGGYAPTRQDVKNNNLEMSNTVQFAVPLGGFTLSSIVGLDGSLTQHTTTLWAGDAAIMHDSLRNNVQWLHLRPHVSERLEFKNSFAHFTLNIPLEFDCNSIRSHISQETNSNAKLMFSPRISLRLMPIGGMEWNVSARFAKSPNTSITDLLPGYYLTSHRYLNRGQFSLYYRQATSASTSLSYRQATIGLFGRVYASWSQNWYNRIGTLNLLDSTGNMLVYSTIPMSNKSQSNEVGGELKWYCHAIGTTAGIDASVSNSASEYLSDGQMRPSQRQTLTWKPSLRFGLLSWSNIDYSYRARHSRYTLGGLQTDDTEQLHTLKFFLFPFKRQILTAEGEYYDISINGSRTTATFANLSYEYKTRNGVSIGLKMLNLFNNTSFNRIRQGNISVEESYYYLRPREILLSVSWSLRRK